MIAAAGAAWLLPACEVPPQLAVVVNVTGTAGDAAPGDGVCEATTGSGDCTLRAAIEETNATATDDLVTIAPGVNPTPGGAVPITGSLVLRGGGATLGERLVHEAGDLTVEDLTITGVTSATTCGGAITSTGDQVVLVRVSLTSNRTTSDFGGGVCATGLLVVADSTIAFNSVGGTLAGGAGVTGSEDIFIFRSVISRNRQTTGSVVSQVLSLGSGELNVIGSFLDATSTATTKPNSIIAPTATGRITSSRLLGNPGVNPAINLAGSLVQGGCTAGSLPTSGGYNRYTAAGCPVTATDAVIADPVLAANGVPEIWSPLVEAIPAGTPDLCPGLLTTDRLGTARPTGGRCDIGDIEVPGRIRATMLPPSTLPSEYVGGDIRAVNDDGDMAGNFLTTLSGFPFYVPVPVAWNADGTYVGIGVLPAGIGPDGTVVGSRPTSATDTEAAAVAPGGTPVGLGTLPGDTKAVATDTDSGRTVGNSGEASALRPWVHTAAGGMVALPTLNGTGEVHDVNSAGLAVGTSSDSGGVSRAVLWDLDAGTITNVGAATTNWTEGVSITDDGDVLGTVGRPDIPETCSDPFNGVAPCPSSSAFTWTADTGTFTAIGNRSNPDRAVGFGPDGTIVVTATRNVLGCAACPKTVDETWLVDPTTGVDVRLPFSQAHDVNADGVVVGNAAVGVPFELPYTVPRAFRVWIAE